MDWSRIKSIFIISFLVLNVFLIRELFIKRSNNQLNTIIEASVEQKLAINDITYPELPKVTGNYPSITRISKEFQEEDLKGLRNQRAKVIDGTRISSVFIEPIHMGDRAEGIDYQNFLSYVKFGEEYALWKRDTDKRTLHFIQKVEGKFIFNNEAATLTAHYNENNQIIAYTQMYLGSLEEIDEEESGEEVIPAIKALESLLERNMIVPNSKVTDVKLGYYRLVTLISGMEVLVPTWRFVVNGTDEYFVNGLEGQIVSINSSEE